MQWKAGLYLLRLSRTRKKDITVVTQQAVRKRRLQNLLEKLHSQQLPDGTTALEAQALSACNRERIRFR